MRKNPFYKIFFIGLLWLLWVTFCQGNNHGEGGDTEDPDQKPFRDLGWTQPYENSDDVDCILVIKEEYWNDVVVHTFIRSVLIKDILEQDPLIMDIEHDEENREKVYFGRWDNGIGRAFYVVQTEYHRAADLILDKLKDYLGAWLDAPLERRLIDQILQLDGRERSSSVTSSSPRRVSEGGSSDSGSSEIPEYNGQGAPPDIKWITSPPAGQYGRETNEQKIANSFRSFYGGAKGFNVDIYVVDSGFSAAAKFHESFGYASHFRRVGSWMKTGGIEPTEVVLTDYDTETYHGTDVTSKIIGFKTGLAPYAKIISAIFNANGEQNRNSCFYAELLLKIRKGILEKPFTKAIINLSVVLDGHLRKDKGDFSQYPFLKEVERNYLDLMAIYADKAMDKVLELDNVIVVTGTGNGDVGDPIRDWPAKRGTREASNLVVVGNADVHGRLNGHVEAEFVKVYGIAEYIAVPAVRSNYARAVNAGKTRYTEEAGISLVVPMISGILACHLSDFPTITPLEAVKKLYKDAYPYEKDSRIKMAWTGPRPTRKLAKRDDPAGDWPILEAEGDGEKKGTGGGETDKKGKKTGKDKTDLGGESPAEDDTDKKDKGTGGDEKTVGGSKKESKKQRCSSKTEWRLRRRKAIARSNSEDPDEKDDKKIKDGKNIAKPIDGADDIGYEDDDEEPPGLINDSDDEYDADDEDCWGDDEDEEEKVAPPPARPSYYSTITVAMHITGIRPTRTRTRGSTRTSSLIRPTLDGWDGTKHAATELMTRPPPVKTFITPNPTPNVGDSGSVMAGAIGVPQEGFANPAPRPGGLQKPVMDRKAMLRASSNRFRGYSSTRRRAATYTPAVNGNIPAAKMGYATVYGVTGNKSITFEMSSTKKLSATVTSPDLLPTKTSTAARTTENTTMDTSIVKPAIGVSNSIPENSSAATMTPQSSLVVA
ncbi:hypothetical protein TWF718_005403 [Orbilia javanica]|uniref:Peptidase S8/S53 domain-containing protein n=1 Tax=Orbilia javanica TaxID=47235 RepID=A0AAN8N7L6_9PEZI